MENRTAADVLTGLRKALRDWAPLGAVVDRTTGMPLSIPGGDATELIPPAAHVAARGIAFSRTGGSALSAEAMFYLPLFGDGAEAAALGVAEAGAEALFSSEERVLSVSLRRLGMEEEGIWEVVLEATVKF